MDNVGTYAQAKAVEDTMLHELVWLVPIGALVVTALGAVLLAIVLPRGRQGAVGVFVATGHLAAAAVAGVVWADRGFKAVMSGTVMVDGLSLMLCMIVGVGGAACVALAHPTVSGTDREGEFGALLAAASLGAVVLGSAADIGLLAISLGLSSLATFVLTGYLRDSPRGNEASIKYYLFGTVSGAAMTYGLSWWFGVTGSTSLAAVGRALPDAPTGVVVGSTALVLVGLGYKAALVPFHFWTPDAYDGAPLSVAAYLSVVSKLAGLAAIARVLPLALPGDTAGWSTAIAVLAALTMTLGNLAALGQRNTVRLLAYSSIAQSGYLLMGIAAIERSPGGLSSFAFYAMAYAVANLTAFAVIIAVQRERRSVDLDALRGLGRAHPWWTAALTLSALSLLGLPPLAGFFAKLEVFRASIDAGQSWLAVVAVVNTVISLVFYLRLCAPAILDRGTPTPGPVRRHRGLRAAMATMAAATVLGGLAAEPLLGLAEAARIL